MPPLTHRVSAAIPAMLNRTILYIILALNFSHSFAFSDGDIPLITDISDIDHYIGKVVTIKGYVTNTKIPTILGVDVKSDKPDLRGGIGQATGILFKWIVTKDEIERIKKVNRSQ